MRYIEFRARWSDTGKEIKTIDFMEDYTIAAINDPAFIVDQFTGLKDRNNIKIFEGDKLIHPDGERFVVVWEKASCQFRALYDDGTTSPLALQIGEKGLAVVCGNIHKK